METKKSVSNRSQIVIFFVLIFLIGGILHSMLTGEDDQGNTTPSSSTEKKNEENNGHINETHHQKNGKRDQVFEWENKQEKKKKLVAKIPADVKVLHSDDAHKKEGRYVYEYDGFIADKKIGYKIDSFNGDLSKEKWDSPLLVLKKLIALYKTRNTEVAMNKSLQYFDTESRKRKNEFMKKEQVKKRYLSHIKDYQYRQERLLLGVKESKKNWYLFTRTTWKKEMDRYDKIMINMYSFRKVNDEWFMSITGHDQTPKSIKNLRLYLMNMNNPDNWHTVFENVGFSKKKEKDSK